MTVVYLLFVSLLICGGCGGGRTAAGACPTPTSVADPRPPSTTTEIKGSASRQLIIKFRPDTVPCTPAGIAQLSSTTRVSLEYVRTMSGGACVVKQFADGADGLLRGQETLRGNPAVEYLEPDARVKAL